METTRFVYWQYGNMWLGYLEEYPDYMTQGESLAELKENLVDIYNDLTRKMWGRPGRCGDVHKIIS